MIDKRPPSGWLVVDKAGGPSSAQLVGKVKWLFKNAGMKLAKIGHGGTLDPLATGVLPLALGEATKTVAYMLDADKAYEFTLAFGSQTSTDDAAGEVIATNTKTPTAADIEGILPQFTGTIAQMPPAVSALKVEGKRAYAMVRQGETPTLKARQITVHTLTLLGIEGHEAQFAAEVSKGTYIRSLARDIALALGTVGHVSRLHRTRHGPFQIADAIAVETLDKLLQTGEKPPILPVDVALHGLAAHHVPPAQAQTLRHGLTLPVEWPDGLARVYAEEILVVLVRVEKGTAKPLRGFNLGGHQET